MNTSPSVADHIEVVAIKDGMTYITIPPVISFSIIEFGVVYLAMMAKLPITNRD